MKNILFTEPVAMHRIWGGTALARRLNVPFEGILPGEITVAAGFPARDTRLRDRAQTLSQFYAAEPDFFGLTQPCFPLAVNLLDAQQRLSVQVHPTEEYARAREDCCGLPEVWVVLDAAGGAELVAGHSAPDRQTFAQLARAGAWEQLLTGHTAARGDCFVLPAGTVHAVGAGIQLYEVTRAADVVYRLWDYDRLDAQGNPRPLQLERALDVVYAPQAVQKSAGTVVCNTPALLVLEFVDLPYVYTVRSIAVFDAAAYTQPWFGVYTVVDGSGSVNGFPLRQGDTFLVPCGGFALHFQGSLTCLMASFREE